MVRNPSVSLTEHQQKDIANLIELGRFQNVSEIMRAGLRLLIDQEEQRASVVKRLEQAALDGIKSGIIKDFDVDDFLARKRNDWLGE